MAAPKWLRMMVREIERPNGVRDFDAHSVPALVSLVLSGAPRKPITDQMRLNGPIRTELKGWLQGFPRTSKATGTLGRAVDFEHTTAVLIALSYGWIGIQRAMLELDIPPVDDDPTPPQAP